MPMIQAAVIVFGCVTPFFSLSYVKLIIRFGVIIVAIVCLIRETIAASSTLRVERVSKAMTPVGERGSTA